MSGNQQRLIHGCVLNQSKYLKSDVCDAGSILGARWEVKQSNSAVFYGISYGYKAHLERKEMNV